MIRIAGTSWSKSYARNPAKSCCGGLAAGKARLLKLLTAACIGEWPRDMGASDTSPSLEASVFLHFDKGATEAAIPLLNRPMHMTTNEVRRSAMRC